MQKEKKINEITKKALKEADEIVKQEKQGKLGRKERLTCQELLDKVNDAL